MQSYIFSIITSVFSVTWSSEMIQICWFAAQETFIIINVENSYTAYYFCQNGDSIFYFILGILWCKKSNAAFIWNENILLSEQPNLCLLWVQLNTFFKWICQLNLEPSQSCQLMQMPCNIPSFLKTMNKTILKYNIITNTSSLVKSS